MTASEIAREALSIAPSQRSDFLDRACRGRPELRAEVEALLGSMTIESGDTYAGAELSASQNSSETYASDADASDRQSGEPSGGHDSPTSGASERTFAAQGSGYSATFEQPHPTSPAGGGSGSSEEREAHDPTIIGTFQGTGDVGRVRRMDDTGVLLDAGSCCDPSEADTTIAGRYRLERMIGEGGMGEVWIAQQSEPVKRRVALKLIKTGLDSKAVLQRFEQERQALALMDHPNIAKVFDAGTTSAGQPFFVMELVDGSPLTKFCDEEKLSLQKRLELFVSICQAVQHAHQKGIVHRDLKPANILVTVVDGRPVPKVIDFGVAKATTGKLTDQTMDTQFGAVIGTLEYMSPEQAGFGGEDIDTRADIYSLGVVLYELLTGLRPIDASRLKKAAMTEMLRIIREDEPSKPSTRLSTSESLPSLAAIRQVEPKKLTALLRGELDWVVMKCLEKSRERRYETANALSRDIQRYLADEPVEARPPSTGYRLRKLLARNKVTAIAAGLILMTLVGGIIGTSLALAEAQRQRAAAVKASNAAMARAVAEARERRRAEMAEGETRKRAEELERIAAFQGSQLSDIKPHVMGAKLREDIVKRRKDSLEAAKIEQCEIDRHIGELEKELAGVNFTNVALDALDENIFGRALKTIDKDFVDQPVIRARLLQTLADTMLQLGLVEQATVPQMQAIEIRRKTLGDAHPETQESIEDLGSILFEQGKHAEAIPYCREVVAIRETTLGPEHPLTLRSLVALTNALVMVQKFEETDSILKKATEDCRRILGADDEVTIRALNMYGLSMHYQGKYKEAEALYREALDASRRKFGIENEQTLASINRLMNTLEALGKYPESEALARESVTASRTLLGDEHPQTFALLDNLAKSLKRQNKFAEAEEIYREILSRESQVLGPDHISTSITMNNLANCLLSSGRGAEAEPLARESLEKTRRIRGAEHRETLVALNTLGQTLAAQGKLSEAVPYWKENLETSRRVLGEDHPDTMIFSFNLGGLLSDLGRQEEAEAYIRDAYEKCKKQFGPDHPNTQTMQSFYGVVLLRLKRYDNAAPFLANSIEYAEKNMPGSIREFRMKASLGAVRFGQMNFAEAEPLLKAGYEGLKANTKTLRVQDRADLYAAAEKLAEIYDTTDRKSDSTKIRAEVEEIRKGFEQAGAQPSGPK